MTVFSFFKTKPAYKNDCVNCNFANKMESLSFVDEIIYKNKFCIPNLFHNYHNRIMFLIQRIMISQPKAKITVLF